LLKIESDHITKFVKCLCLFPKNKLKLQYDQEFDHKGGRRNQGKTLSVSFSLQVGRWIALDGLGVVRQCGCQPFRSQLDKPQHRQEVLFITASSKLQYYEMKLENVFFFGLFVCLFSYNGI